MAYKTDVGGWQVRYFPENAPTGCIMGGDYKDGTRLSIIVSAQYEWALALSNPAWNLKKDSSTDVAVQVDQKFVASGKAAHYDRTIAVLPLTGSAPFRALQTGHRLDLQTPSGNLNFQLTSSGKAMYALLDCVKTLQPQQPTPGPAAAGDFQMVPQAEATVMLTNLFNAAGIHGWHLETPKQGDTSIGFGLAGGSIGFLRAARGRTALADDYAAFVISKWSELCKGKYLSGKQSVPSTDGSVVRKIVTTCSAEGRERDTATETTIIRQSDGFLMELTQVIAIGSNAMPAGNPDKQDHEAVINAALRKR
jgi:hypothetical protein